MPEQRLSRRWCFQPLGGADCSRFAAEQPYRVVNIVTSFLFVIVVVAG